MTLTDAALGQAAAGDRVASVDGEASRSGTMTREREEVASTSSGEPMGSSAIAPSTTRKSSCGWPKSGAVASGKGGGVATSRTLPAAVPAALQAVRTKEEMIEFRELLGATGAERDLRRPRGVPDGLRGVRRGPGEEVALPRAFDAEHRGEHAKTGVSVGATSSECRGTAEGSTRTTGGRGSGEGHLDCAAASGATASADDREQGEHATSGVRSKATSSVLPTAAACPVVACVAAGAGEGTTVGGAIGGGKLVGRDVGFR